MAKIKKPFIVFQTEEEFTEKMDKFYDQGRVRGFEDGAIWAASYFYELMQDMFKHEAFVKMQKEITDRHIEEWRQKQEYKSLKWHLDHRKDLLKTLDEKISKES